MRKIFYAFACIAIFAFASCNLNYSTTKSGTKYKIFSGKATGAESKGKQIKPGDIVKYNFKFGIAETDSIIRDLYGKVVQYAKADTGASVRLSPTEIFTLMKTGDSAVLMVSVDSILAQMGPGNAPPFFKKGGHIKASISILNVFTSDSLARVDMTKEQELQQKRDEATLEQATKDLDKYISDKGIKATKTKNGVYVVIDKPGDISLKADSGMQAMVKYTGIVLNGKKPFDSNIDSVSPNFHKDPIPVVVGSHGTIPGWEEALPYFGKGGKGKIYIPSKLGYGSRDNGPDMPAFSNLVFDIEVVDVTKPSAAPAGPAGANPQTKMTPEQQKQMMEQLKKQMEAQQAAKPTGK